MNRPGRIRRCRVCGADITYDAAVGLWTDRLGHAFCGQPPGGRLIPAPRPAPGAVRFPPTAAVTSDEPADGTGSARRLRALIAIGHSGTRLALLARQYGAPVSGRDIAALVMPPSGAQVTVSRGTRDAICCLFDDLWDQAPPEHSPGERAAAAAARAWARQHDWPAPAAWDDDRIDDPAYQPEAGWLPATLAGVPQHRFIAPPAPITRRRARSSEPSRPARVTSDQHRRVAGTQHNRQEAADGTTPA